MKISPQTVSELAALSAEEKSQLASALLSDSVPMDPEREKEIAEIVMRRASLYEASEMQSYSVEEVMSHLNYQYSLAENDHQSLPRQGAVNTMNLSHTFIEEFTALSDTDKTELANVLLSQVTHMDSEREHEIMEEAHRRYTSYQEGRTTARNVEEVLAQYL